MQNTIMPRSTFLGVTTMTIQQVLEENNQLIMIILQNRNAGKEAANAVFEARLQRNLTYLAAVAEAQDQMQATPQPPPPIAPAARYLVPAAPAPHLVGRYMPYQRPRGFTSQRNISVAPSLVVYPRQHQQQQQHQATSSGANNELNSRLGGAGGQARRSMEGIEPIFYFRG